MRVRGAGALVVAAAVLAGFGAGCASAPRSGDDLRREVASRALDERRLVEPLELAPAMRQWLHERIVSSSSPATTLEQLLHELQALGLEYDAGYTGTAEEVFTTHRFNCLSFTMLFVALARELGVPVYYLDLDWVQEYEGRDDLVIASQHITAAYGAGQNQLILEFDVGPGVNYRAGRRIGDQRALAMYYSNRGAELVTARRHAEALAELRTAVAIDPELEEAWINLGVGLRRSGDLAGAEDAYRRAIALDPRSVPALHDLAVLLRLEGHADASREILALLDRRGNRDPFIYLALGDGELEGGRLGEAERFYRRALRLSHGDAESRAAMGLWALAVGRPEQAAAWLRQARERDPDNRRVLRLSERLAPDQARDSGG